MDITKFIPFYTRTTNYRVSAANVYQSVLNISSGKGFFVHALMQSGEWANVGFKVTVDGEVFFLSEVANSSDRGLGIMHAALMYNSGTVARHPRVSTWSDAKNNNSRVGLPYTTGAAAMAVITSPVYFNKSLKVEVRCSSTVVDLQIFLEGGYI